MSKFETSALAAAGYSGFIPNIKYEIGKSYGNATGEILERDKVFQARRQRMAQEIASKQHQYDNEDSRLLHSGCANGDERFSHALVSGYTGFVPRLQEHFGKGYVKTTQEALHDFAEMLDKREQLPPKLAALYERAKQMQLQGGNNGSSASVNSIANAANGNRLPPIEQDEHQFSRSFMSGYTGYIPQLKNHFGKSVRRTIADGDIHYHITSKLHRTNGHSDLSSISRAIPIPGFTGIGGNDDNDDAFYRHLDITGSLKKDLTRCQPISGYMGHIQGYAFTAEKPYRQSAKQCLEKYAQSKIHNK